MKKYVLGVLALVSPLAFGQTEIKFDTNVTFFHGLPNDIYLGEASGIAVSPRGRIAIYSRGNSTAPLTPPPPRSSLIRFHRQVRA